MVKSIFKTRRLLLKQSKYKRITIDDSNVITLETYVGKVLPLYCDNNDDSEQSKMSMKHYNDKGIDNDEDQDEFEKDEEDEEEEDVEDEDEEEEDDEEDKDDEDDENEEEDDDEEDKEDEIDEIEKEDNNREGKSPLQRKQRCDKKRPHQQRGIEEPMSNNYIEMGQDLNVILQNIHKLPTPPPTNNPQYTTNKYRSILINHLTKIENVDKFELNIREIFIPVDESSASASTSSKSSINYILNEGDMESVDPDTLINLPIEDFEKKQTEVCEFFTNKIINIYETTVKDQIQSELLRRGQFNNLILLLKYYEKLEVFCNLHLLRGKGKTVKAQAIKMIVKSSKPSKENPPQIKSREITVVLSQAARMRRLLDLAKNNYNIFYAFPDLHPQFFLPKKLNVVNFERWLKLVETGKLPSAEIGEKLYNEYKVEIKKRRLENLNI